MTVRVDRRQFLSGVVMAAGAAALPATSAPSTERVDEEACEADACSRERYDKGLVPIRQSRWFRIEASFPSYSALDQDLDADVTVIGAGLAGGSLALHLAEALARDDPSRLPLPIASPEEVGHPMAKSHLYRGVLIPLARLAEGISLI